jgi:hypothetical protein
LPWRYNLGQRLAAYAAVMMGYSITKRISVIKRVSVS